MHRIFGVVFSGILLLALASESSAETPLTVRGVAASYQNYLKSIRSISFRAMVHDRFADGREHDGSEDWKIDLAGHRSWRGTIIEEESHHWEDLVTPNRDISLSADPKTLQADVVCSNVRVLPESWMVWVRFAPLLGYLDTQGRALDPISASQGAVTIKWRTGAPVVLTSRTAARQLTLWLAPTKGWMPERIDYVRSAPAAKGGDLVRLTYLVTRARQVDGIWFPEKFTVEQTTAAGKYQLPKGMVERQQVVVDHGVETTVTVTEIVEGAEGSAVEVPQQKSFSEAALTDIKLNAVADGDFHLKATIPDGTEVSMQDDRNGAYVWQDGKAVLVPEKPPLFASFYGRLPPELEITDARGVPQTVKLADLRGKWVLIDFWSPGCGPCVAESLPALAKFYTEHAADRDRFEILAICANWNNSVRTMEEFDRAAAPITQEHWAGKPLPFPVLIDGELKTFEAYGIEGVPQTLLVDPEGNLVADGDLTTLAAKLKAAKR